MPINWPFDQEKSDEENNYISLGNKFLNNNKNINFSKFQDIIYKNPAYTVGELIDLHLDAEEMDWL